MRTPPLKMIDPQIDDLEFESDSDEVGSDLDMDQIPEDREQEDSDEVQSIFYGAEFISHLGIESGTCHRSYSTWIDCQYSGTEKKRTN